jgi:hypothetical protein
VERTDTELPADVAALMRERGVPPAIASGICRYVLTEIGPPESLAHEDILDQEISSYFRVQAFDFGEASLVRQQILDHAAAQFPDSGTYQLTTIEFEIEHFHELKEAAFDGVPPDYVARLKAEAAELFKGLFDQFDHLETVIRAEMDTARGDPAGVAGHFRSALAAPFSPRTYLGTRELLLVHFSTVMTSHDDLFFPEDLRRALTLKGVPLAFSTIQIGDTNPHRGGRGGAEGSIGIIIDRGPGMIIHSVSPGDSGSNPFGSLGKLPTAGNCASSINLCQTSNEWVIEDYQPVGIFLLRPLLARQPVKIDGIDEPVPMEVPIDERQVIAAFPGQRIFSADAQSFFEWRSHANQWTAIRYWRIFDR